VIHRLELSFRYRFLFNRRSAPSTRATVPVDIATTRTAPRRFVSEFVSMLHRG